MENISEAIRVNNLWFTYPNGVNALKDINLTILKGEIVALIGENGAGKTTLAKHFIGLLKPTKGTVEVFGVDTRKTTVATLAKKVGFVFQNPDYQLFAETVWDEVAFALKNFNFPEEEIKKRVREALEVFDLLKYEKVSPLALSGGERKRVAIASVVCYDPEILILDEPTIGQDQIQKNKIIELIRTFANKGKTIIIITHDMDFVADIEPRVILLSKGKVLADGRARDILPNLSLLEAAHLLPNQVGYLSWLFSRYDSYFPHDIIKVNEFVEAFLKMVKNDDTK
ncbi:MAG: energy-coupling factor ABC transporter ATP-binding protein [Thermoprotei archaeon]|jgi:energy-coupling factor transport system ATP-binding protein